MFYILKNENISHDVIRFTIHRETDGYCSGTIDGTVEEIKSLAIPCKSPMEHWSIVTNVSRET